MTLSASSSPDLLSGLLPPSPYLDALRHSRDKVLRATQDSHQALFAPALDQGLDLRTRHAVALYVAVLNGQPALAAHYRDELQKDRIDPQWQVAIDADQLDAIDDPVLRQILGYVRLLTLTPEQGDREALQALRAQGLQPAEVVSLAQLVAFLAFQSRLLGGLALLGTRGGEA